MHLHVDIIIACWEKGKNEIDIITLSIVVLHVSTALPATTSCIFTDKLALYFLLIPSSRYEKRQALKARFEIEQKLRRERKAEKKRLREKEERQKRMLLREKRPRTKEEKSKSRAMDELKARRGEGAMLQGGCV